MWRAADQAALPTDQALVNAVLDHFRRGDYTYTVTPPSLGRHSVDEFLFDTRLGFCEHYASAFVVLMRALGVPARVVTGYQGGELNPVDGFVTVRQSDAHAWAEVWLHGRGWIRVDPTGTVAPLRLERGAAEIARESGRALQGLGSDVTFLRTLRYNWEAIQNNWNQWVLSYSQERQRALVERLGLAPTLENVALVLAFVMAALLGWLAFVSLRPRTVRDPLGAAYVQLRERLERAGVAASVSCGPRELYARTRACPHRRGCEDGPQAAVALRAAALWTRIGERNPHRRSRAAARDPGVQATSESAVTTRRRLLLALLAGASLPAHARTGYLARDEVQQFIDAMVASHGFERVRLERWLRDARYSATVERLMQPPIPFAQRNWLEYRNRYIEPARIDAGLAFWRAQRSTLDRAEDQFGVPAEIIVAIIGIETYYGRNTGNFRTLDVFTTLTFDYPRRADFYRSEFEEFLLLAREQKADPTRFAARSPVRSACRSSCPDRSAAGPWTSTVMAASTCSAVRPTRSGRSPTSSQHMVGSAASRSCSKSSRTKQQPMRLGAASCPPRPGHRLWPPASSAICRSRLTRRCC